MSEQQLPHEWDDDACCIHCGFDGAEAWHLTKFCRQEEVRSDRICVKRSEEAARAAYWGTR